MLNNRLLQAEGHELKKKNAAVHEFWHFSSEPSTKAFFSSLQNTHYTKFEEKLIQHVFQGILAQLSGESCLPRYCNLSNKFWHACCHEMDKVQVWEEDITFPPHKCFQHRVPTAQLESPILIKTIQNSWSFMTFKCGKCSVGLEFFHSHRQNSRLLSFQQLINTGKINEMTCITKNLIYDARKFVYWPCKCTSSIPELDSAEIWLKKSEHVCEYITLFNDSNFK